MAKFIVTTDADLPRKSFFDTNTVQIYQPGWYGSYPHFQVSPPYEDGIGTQHLRFTIKDSPGCDKRAIGMTIGLGHVPCDYRMITKSRLNQLLEKERILDEYLKVGHQFSFQEMPPIPKKEPEHA